MQSARGFVRSLLLLLLEALAAEAEEEDLKLKMQYGRSVYTEESFLALDHIYGNNNHINGRRSRRNELVLKSSLPLPKLGLSSPWVNLGVRICGNERTNHYLHLTWGVVFALAGIVQIVAGIYFMMELPIFQLGSNIWTGAWNLFSSVVTLLLCCSSGGLNPVRCQCLLLLSLVVIVVNLTNLVILEVGEWRGFLTDEDRDFIRGNGMEAKMHDAYMSSTVSTVVAMIASFFASQQTFCFLQLSGGVAARNNGNENGSSNGRVGRFSTLDEDVMVTKDIVKRHNDMDDLNLKTPNGPQPHPSWVYRNNNNNSNFNQGSSRSPVKRSLSLLQGKGDANQNNHNNNSNSQFDLRKFDLIGTLTKGAGHGSSNSMLKKPKLSNIPETSLEHKLGHYMLPEVHNNNNNSSNNRHGSSASHMRHAVIRRHQSMYIHPRTTTEIQPTFNIQQQQQHYKLQEVSGKSEIRPIVTLQRSKTTAGSMLHYRSTSIQALHSRSTFNTLATSGRAALLPESRSVQHLAAGVRRKGYEELCEFQAGRSFDLPDPEKFRRRRYLSNWNGGMRDKESNNDPNDVCVVFDDSEVASTIIEQQGFSHRFVDQDSCHNTIRYQAVEGLVQSARPQARMRQSHYSSLENLLVPPPEKSSPQILLRSHFGSTESLSSLGCSGGNNSRDDSGNPSRTTQTPNSSHCNLSKDGEEEEEEEDDLYDVPKKPSNLQKSNSRVTSVGKLRLHVESFRQVKHTSGTQTDLTAMLRSNNDNNNNNHKYTAQFKKNSAPPPSKPIRKTKPGNNSHNNSSSRSDRSASPDGNSSTSGYSSPSAGLHSKETSPYGSKLEEEEEEDNGSKITVIQIIPATLNNGMMDSGDQIVLSSAGGTRYEEDEEEEEEREEELPMSAASAVMEQRRQMRQHQQQQQQHPTTSHRELPRLRPMHQQQLQHHQQNQPQQQQKRRLPDRALVAQQYMQKQQQEQQQQQQEMSTATLPRMNHNNQNNNNFNTINRRLYRSNLPRPSAAPPPMNQFSQSAGNRVPLPPVPELDRSDHERESISPVPTVAAAHELLRSSRPLPSPLTTPVLPNINSQVKQPPVARARRQPVPPTSNNNSSRIPRSSLSYSHHQLQQQQQQRQHVQSHEEVDEQEYEDDVDGKLMALLSLLNQKGSAVDGKDTLQYLSQLENVARRLKDQLLMEKPQVHNRLQPRKESSSTPAGAWKGDQQSDC